MKKLLVAFTAFLFTTVLFGQELDAYKYVVIPYEFEFTKRHNQFKVNALTRYLFKNEGFHVLYDSEVFPDDLNSNRCLALFADVQKKSGLLSTKTVIELKDCNGKVVLLSKEGKSKIKDYTKAYNESIRKAFTSVEAQNYSYKASKTAVTGMSVAPPKEVVELKPETPKVVEVVEVKEVKEVKEEKIVKTPKVKPKEIKVQEVPEVTTTSEVLYAQPIPNGFQLVDTTPKVVYKIRKSGAKDVYIVIGRDAIIRKNGADWILDYYVDGVLHSKSLDIKF